MSLLYQEKASEFAKSWGWDGVMQPFDGELDGVPVPIGFEPYIAGFYNPNGEHVQWHPMFDNAPHVIVANEHEVRWRTPDDAVRLER